MEKKIALLKKILNAKLSKSELSIISDKAKEIISKR